MRSWTHSQTQQMSVCHARVQLFGSLGNGVAKPEVSKVDAVQKWATPQTKKQVRAFLGLTGYYRKFVPNYAAIATPLTDLTRKFVPNKITWTKECDLAFAKLKAILCNAAVLHSPDFQKEFILQTDASDRSVGAVLSQQHSDGNEQSSLPSKPIVFIYWDDRSRCRPIIAV